jgi:Fic family protein
VDRGPSGRFDSTSFSGERVNAFVPSPLPPVPEMELTSDRQLQLEQALLACGRLDGVSALLPDPNLFLYAYVRREAVLSSQIEGTQSSLSDLLLFEINETPGVPFDDVVEVSNYVAALEHGVARMKEGFPLSNRLIREMHGKLLERGRGAAMSPGEFRTTQNWIGGTRPGNAHFVPPPPTTVEECMAALERFIHNDGSLPILVRAAVAHVQFESIHPFLDGNGRLGRLLIALMLHHAGVLRQPLLYLSLFLKQRRADYYRLLDLVRQEGDWEAWLDFFLEGVNQTASAAVDTAHRLLQLFRDDQQQLEKEKVTVSAYRVFEAFKARPIASVNEIVKRTSITFPTASAAIEALVALKIVKEITGNARNRLFAYQSYLAILSEGTEPLAR